MIGAWVLLFERCKLKKFFLRWKYASNVSSGLLHPYEFDSFCYQYGEVELPRLVFENASKKGSLIDNILANPEAMASIERLLQKGKQEEKNGNASFDAWDVVAEHWSGDQAKEFVQKVGRAVFAKYSQPKISQKNKAKSKSKRKKNNLLKIKIQNNIVTQ